MPQPKVLFINPNPRQMSLVQPVVALFYSILKDHDIEMKFFDTTFYDISEDYIDANKYMENIRVFKKIETSTLEHSEPLKNGEQLFRDFRHTVESFKPDIIMASALESTVIMARQMLASVRDLQIPHVLGGVFSTYAPELAISFDEFDVICVGEAEEIIVPLVEKLINREKLDGMPGIWAKTKDGIIRNPIASPYDLEKAPRFDGSIFDDSRFYRAMHGKVYRMVPIETHRGCPLKCTFCNSPIQNTMYKEETGERYFRMKSIKKVMEDIRYSIEKLNAEYLFFWADNFLAYSKESIDEFAKAYSEFKIPFYVQSYPTTLNEYKLKKLVEVGLHRLGMGVEHGNEKFRKDVIDRPYSNKEAIRQVGILKKYNIQYALANIVGFPTETPKLHLDTVNLARALEPITASCSTFTPFHGTPMRKLSIEKGFLKDPDTIAPTNTEYSILDMPEFTKDQIAGKARTFNLYLKFPESRWNEIKRAEAQSLEGNRIWNELVLEYDEKYA